MCFSASASFLAGVLLLVLGVSTLLLTYRRRDFLFAAVPILFGFQQLIEGFVWLSFDGANSATSGVAVHTYVFFAYVLWPAWIPAAVLAQEPPGRRHSALFGLLGVGALVALGFAIVLVMQPVTAYVTGHSVVYDVSRPWRLLHGWAYIVATCGSCLLSSRRWIVGFGLAAFVSAGIAYPFYREAFASVWCFFAAILSLLVFFHFWNARQSAPTRVPAGL